MPPDADAGLLKYTASCEHHEQLAEILSKLAERPGTASLAVLPPKRLPALPVPETPTVINRNPAPQPWEPRPARNRAA